MAETLLQPFQKSDFITETGDKLSMLVQANLSDAQIEMDFESRESAKYKLKFIKFCIHHFDGNLDVRVDTNKLFNDFKLRS